MSRARMPFRAWPRHPITGKQVTISARTERELVARVHAIETMRGELKVGMRSIEQVDTAMRRLVHGPITLARAAVAYARRGGLAPDTSRRVLGSWLPGPARALAERELEALDASTLQQWIDRLVGEGSAPSSIRTAWWTLRAVARYATTRGWLGASPWGDWRPTIRGARRRTDREAARSPEELAQLLAAAHEIDDERGRANRRALCDFEARIAAVALLGLRQGELAGLRWRDLDESMQTVTVARQWAGKRPPKGRLVHTLRALPELFALLTLVRARLEALGLLSSIDDGPVFPDARAAAVDGVARHHVARGRPFPLPLADLRVAVERAGLPRPKAWTATSLRDTYATLEAAAYGTDLAGLASRTRHASIASLLRYLRARSRGLAAPGFQLPPAAPALPALPPAPPPPTADTSVTPSRRR